MRRKRRKSSSGKVVSRSPGPGVLGVMRPTPRSSADTGEPGSDGADEGKVRMAAPLAGGAAGTSLGRGGGASGDGASGDTVGMLTGTSSRVRRTSSSRSSNSRLSAPPVSGAAAATSRATTRGEADVSARAVAAIGD